MARRPVIPRGLKYGPFSLAEARAAGISRTALQGRTWRHLGRDLYCWSGLLEDPLKTLFAYQRLVHESLYAGNSAAWLYRIDVDPINPIEVIVPPTSGIRSRRGLNVRHVKIPANEIARVRGLRATNATRTLFDVCRLSADVEALIVLDQAIRLRLVDRVGASRIHHLGALAEGAESPMESRLRWLLLKAGLPRPEVQRNLLDSNGRFVGRADLYFPEAGLVIEYDGGNHRDRLVEDNHRQNLLVDAGYALLRFTAPDLKDGARVVTLVRRRLSAAAAASSTRQATAPR